MTPSNPQTIDGKTYDFYSMNLVVSSKYNEASEQDASIVCQFIPTRIEDGVVDMAQGSAVNLQVGSLSQADSATLTAVAAIQSAIQNFIKEKGL